MVSGYFLPLRYCAITKEIQPLGIRLGLFPLWLRTPRFLCAALFLASRACWRVARGRLLFGERKLFLSPAQAPPRSFGVRLRTTPLHVFICVLVVSLPLRKISDF